MVQLSTDAVLPPGRLVADPFDMAVSPSCATEAAARPCETLQLHRLREQIQLPRMQFSMKGGVELFSIVLG